MNDYSFGNFLCTLREEKGLSQSELGKMLGVTNKAVSKWENGAAKPNTKLIPQIAEIFGITVEELFAGKRIEKDSELESIKSYLIKQKRKFAILSSVFFSLIITSPLLLLEFTSVIMGFGLPDEVLGPLGSVSFIILFIVSLVSFINYRSNFKRSLLPTEKLYSSRDVNAIKLTMILCAIGFWISLTSIIPVCFFLLAKTNLSIRSAAMISCAAIFVLILILGTFICAASIKHLLKIKFKEHVDESGNKIVFSKAPLWYKICFFAMLILLPINIRIQLFGETPPISISLILLLAFYGALFAISVYNYKQSKK